MDDEIVKKARLARIRDIYRSLLIKSELHSALKLLRVGSFAMLNAAYEGL